MDNSIKVVENVHWVGALHPDLKVFDDLFPTHNGTTYNSYLIQGSKKTALIDTVKEPFTEDFFSKIGEHLDPAKIDLVVVNHTEPDHSGALVHIIEKNPKVQIYCSKAAANFLTQLLNRSFNAVIVSDGDEIDLGGKTLRFFLTPYLHWPDTIFTYLVEDELLFSCDAFGAHYCSTKLFDDEIHEFFADFHIIDAGLAEGLVNSFHKLIGEMVIIDQSAVTDRTVKYFDFFTKHE